MTDANYAPHCTQHACKQIDDHTVYFSFICTIVLRSTLYNQLHSAHMSILTRAALSGHAKLIRKCQGHQRNKQRTANIATINSLCAHIVFDIRPCYNKQLPAVIVQCNKVLCIAFCATFD